MKIQFAAIIKDRHGEPATEPDVAKSTSTRVVVRTITLADMVVGALDSVFQDEANEGWRPKMRRAELIEKITIAEKAGESLEMLDADVEMIKERIAKRNYSTMNTASAIRLLEKGDGE